MSIQQSKSAAQYTQHITIAALAAHDNKDGTFSIELPARELSDAERDLMLNLFPYLYERAYGLLINETLLAASDPQIIASLRQRGN